MEIGWQLFEKSLGIKRGGDLHGSGQRDKNSPRLCAGEIAVRYNTIDLRPRCRTLEQQPETILLLHLRREEPTCRPHRHSAAVCGPGRTIRRARTFAPTRRVLFSQVLDRCAWLFFTASFLPATPVTRPPLP